MYYPSTIPRIADYHRPTSLGEAVTLLAQYGKDARILSGGTDLVPLMRNQVLAPTCAIDITRIPGLDYIRFDEADGLRLGALATLHDIERSEIVKKRYHLLYESSLVFASATLRHQATVAGNICRASPAADTAGPLICLDATVQVVGPNGTRAIPITEFFAGPGQTALKDGELVAEVHAPTPAPGTGTAFLKLMRVAEDLAQVSASAVVTVRDGGCVDARIALGAVGPIPLRMRRSEQAIIGTRLGEAETAAAAQAAVEDIKPISDLRATKEYRIEMTSVLVTRAIQRCIERALS